MTINSIAGKTIYGIGEAKVTRGRMEQMGLGDADMFAWEGLVYGTYGKIAQNINTVLNGNYVNNEQYVKSTTDDDVILYKADKQDAFADIDFSTGNATLKTSKEVAQDTGLVTPEGESVVNYFSLGQNSMRAVTLQYAPGAKFGSVSADLNQAAFNSKWLGTWERYNVDWNSLTQTSDSEDAKYTAMLASEALYENAQIFTKSEINAINSITDSSEQYKLILETLAKHSFGIATE